MPVCMTDPEWKKAREEVRKRLGEFIERARALAAANGPNRPEWVGDEEEEDE